MGGPTRSAESRANGAKEADVYIGGGIILLIIIIVIVLLLAR